jgi:predicted SAM-dependent methyltransferase
LIQIFVEKKEMEKKVKLHLGCGQKYLEGYVNIDFPTSEHTVQQTSVADEFHNLYILTYKTETINEVRLHHVFEHFERVVACAFMAAWNSWLELGGILHIEVPDFEMSFKKNFSFTARKKYEGVALRHIFGSQEASWAVHYEGYSKKRLEKVFESFGFETIFVNQYNYKRTYNIEVKGKKTRTVSFDQAVKAARLYLEDYLVDDSESEKRMLEVWMNNFKKQLEISFAK